MKVKWASCPTLAPPAAPGILKAMLFRPQLRWRIRRLAVMPPMGNRESAT